MSADNYENQPWPLGKRPTQEPAPMTDERLAFITQQAGKFPSVMAQMALECAREIKRLRGEGA